MAPSGAPRTGSSPGVKAGSSMVKSRGATSGVCDLAGSAPRPLATQTAYSSAPWAPTWTCGASAASASSNERAAASTARIEVRTNLLRGGFPVKGDGSGSRKPWGQPPHPASPPRVRGRGATRRKRVPPMNGQSGCGGEGHLRGRREARSEHLLELHREAVVAPDLDLPGHEGHPGAQGPVHEREQVGVLDGDGALRVRRGALRHRAAGSREVDEPVAAFGPRDLELEDRPDL